MLEDRGYMRQSPFDARRSVTATLLIVNVAVFILQCVIDRFPSIAGYYWYYLPLSLSGLMHGFVWQLLTYQFMHANLLHLLFNCFVIYMFGTAVEEALSRKSYLTLYLGSGVVGGVVQLLAGLLPFGAFGGPVVGASAAGFGLTAAYATLFPDRVILLFFILPIRAKYLLALFAGFALLGVIAPPSAGPGAVHVADAAHLGGMLAGFLFIRYASSWQWPQFPRRRRQPVRRVARVASPKAAFWGRSKDAEEEVPADEFLRKEVDPILDKISAHGIQSLTERERRILEAAREKMAKR
jgi:membrane associated rhomboid family serine protease